MTTYQFEIQLLETGTARVSEADSPYNPLAGEYPSEEAALAAITGKHGPVDVQRIGLPDNAPPDVFEVLAVAIDVSA